MKISFNCRSSHGFTLIELLVVIAIIAILATVAVPVANKVREQSRRTSAANDCRQLENAIKSYYAEYFRYPSNSDSEGPYESDGVLMDTLMDNNTAEADDLNPRSIAFFEVSKFADKPTGQGYHSSSGRFNDPWGQVYQIYMDADDDEEMTVPALYSSRWGRGGRIKKTIFVHSSGPDRKFGETRDNVTSWD